MARVRARRRETADTVSLDVEGGGEGFAPGQFNMLYVFGQGEIPISISGSPSPGVLTHTVRSVGPVSAALSRTTVGSEIGLRGPFGRPWPVPESRGRDLIVIAGGLGLAPLRPAIRAVLADRAAYGRVAVLYGARTPADLLYGAELDTWRARSDVDVDITVDAAEPGWVGNVGVVTELLRRLRFDPRSALAFVCGPEVMMRFAIRELEAHGLDGGAISLSVERNMQCGTGICGHCQLGPVLICRDGPVFTHPEIEPYLEVRGL